MDWDSLNVKLLHIGYILLLDALDELKQRFGSDVIRRGRDFKKDSKTKPS